MLTAFEIVLAAMTTLVHERVHRLFTASLLDPTVLKFHQNCFGLLFCPQLRRAIEAMPQFQALSFHERYQAWTKVTTMVEENAYHFSSQWQVFHVQAVAFQAMEQQAKPILIVDPRDYELHHPFD